LGGSAADTVDFDVGYCCPSTGLTFRGAGATCYPTAGAFYCSSTTPEST